MGSLGVIPQLGATHSGHFFLPGFRGRFGRGKFLPEFPLKAMGLPLTPTLPTPLSLHSDFL